MARKNIRRRLVLLVDQLELTLLTSWNHISLEKTKQNKTLNNPQEIIDNVFYCKKTSYKMNLNLKEMYCN